MIFIVVYLSVGSLVSHPPLDEPLPRPVSTHPDILKWNWSDGGIFPLGRGVTGGSGKVFVHSPDGKHIAHTSGISIWVYDLESKRLTELNEGCETEIRSLAYSPDGLMLAAGTGHGAVELWEVKSQRLLDSLVRDAPDSRVETLAFSPDGKTLASGTSDDIKLWNIETRTHLVTLRGNKNRVAALAVSPEGETLAVREEDDIVNLWAIATGISLATFKYPRRASDRYTRAAKHFENAKTADKDLQQAAIESVIAEFRYIVAEYADSMFADLSLAQIGEAYMILADEDHAYWNDALDSFDKLWEKYLDEPPVNARVAKALRFAQSQVAKISSCMTSNNIPRRTTGVPE
ncbi:MAG: hypothetical protein OXN17_11605 [Candidatus Poribacteria bacterium]|nr:hypothetical protein [Candidatus Poribacteria bacterium]MDE0505700.1 hypothetical protein [Candidatus Poribacteria bacterium]